MKKPLIIALLKYGLGFGLLGWMIWSNWEGLGEALSQPINWAPFLLAGVICLACVLLTFVRWYVLVRALDLPFTLTNALRLGLVGFYFSTFLPGAVGGDIIKAACIAREQRRRTIAVATVVLDRAVGLCGLLWLVATVGGFFWASGMLASLVSSPQAVVTLETIVAISAAISAGTIVFWILLGVLPDRRAEIFAGRLERLGKIGHAFAEFWRAVWLYRSRGRSIALALGLSVVGHVGFVAVFFFASRTLSPSDAIPTFGGHYLLVPVGMTFEAGFPAPGGMGGGEAAYGLLYKTAGYREELGVLASLMRRLLYWILGFCGYLVYLRMKPSLPDSGAASSPPEEYTGTNDATGTNDPAKQRLQPNGLDVRIGK